MSYVDTHRAVEALHAIPPDIPRDEWVKAGMGAQAAGLSFDEFDQWSAQGGNYDPRAARDAWHSFKPGKGIGAGTLFKIAQEHGWSDGHQAERKQLPAPAKPARSIAPGCSDVAADDVWRRCIPATAAHPYVMAKAAEGAPLEGLRVVPEGDPLRIMGESMAGALVLPLTRPDGTLSSLQFITPPATAERLKARGKATKPNLPGARMEGWYVVGDLVPGGVAYVCEGIGQAWACWQATGEAAVVCFGWGRVRAVSEALRQQDPNAQLVLVPDAGKESEAAKIAADVGAHYVTMPEGWPQNSDVNDLAQREGADALEVLLAQLKAPAKRYKLLGSDDLSALPQMRWRVRGVFPAKGLAALYGPSASGKSFLAMDMATAIAEGRRWFDCRVESAPVVYLALEGEEGVKVRVQAWEAHTGRKLPADMHIVLQPFKLTDPQDVRDIADATPRGAVLFIDTLNRAAPTADENSSADMGLILESAKRLQALTGGLVVLVHHTGKDTTKGLRGHSSLFAALDAGVEVSRDGDRRTWSVAKSKDGADGIDNQFTLQVETLGTDEYGDAITSCVVVPAGDAKQVFRSRAPKGGNQKVIYDGLGRLLKDSRDFGKAGAPPTRPCVDMDAAVEALAPSLPVEPLRRKERAKDAISRLVGSGAVQHMDGWLWLP
jgi:hypothetical protein